MDLGLQSLQDLYTKLDSAKNDLTKKLIEVDIE